MNLKIIFSFQVTTDEEAYIRKTPRIHIRNEHDEKTFCMILTDNKDIYFSCAQR